MGLLSPAFILGLPCEVLADDIGRHPVIGDKPARELLNAHLLNLPERERQAWVNGAVNMSAQVVASERPELAGCLLNWFIEGGSGHTRLDKVMRSYPSERATSSVFAVAKLGCDDL
ncbi:MAG: hypothetical protein AAGI89_09960 [Pseudomonadota bacterium]